MLYYDTYYNKLCDIANTNLYSTISVHGFFTKNIK